MTILFDLCTPERDHLWFLRPVYTSPGLCVCVYARACVSFPNEQKVYFTSSEAIIAIRCVQSFPLFLTVVLDS